MVGQALAMLFRLSEETSSLRCNPVEILASATADPGSLLTDLDDEPSGFKPPYERIDAAQGVFVTTVQIEFCMKVCKRSGVATFCEEAECVEANTRQHETINQ